MSICQNCTTDCQRIVHGGDVGNHHRPFAVGFAKVAAAHVFGQEFQYPSEDVALVIGTIRITDEEEEHLLLFEHDLLDTKTLAEHTEWNHADEFLGHLGDLAEAVFQTVAVGLKGSLQVVAVSQVVEFAVEQHTLGVVGDILVREEHLDI